MKLQNFSIEKETDKAVLIKCFLTETGKDESFWLPKSKIDLNTGEITDDNFWNEKIQELKKPKEDPMVIIKSKAYEKGEKATKLIVDVEFNGKPIELFVWLPNSQIIDMNLKNEGEDKLYLVTAKDWVWQNSYNKAIDYQLEFYNKDEIKFSHSDFKLLSPVE